MRRILLGASWLLGIALPSPAWAQQEAVVPVADSARPEFEGAIGLQLNNSPQYQGSDLRKTSLIPGVYLRWGRFSLATASNFVTRRDDEVIRGFGAELIQRDNLRMSLGLRYDPGRKTSASADLAQLDDVRSTIRARLSVVWEPLPNWRVGAGLSSDLLGHQGGSVTDFGLAREFHLSQRTRWTLGSGVSWADKRYMQARFGISSAASARSGKPAYDPGAGWRDVALSTQLRTDIDRHWSVWAGGTLSRLLGPTLDSPLTTQPTQATVGTGFAWRF